MPSSIYIARVIEFRSVLNMHFSVFNCVSSFFSVSFYSISVTLVLIHIKPFAVCRFYLQCRSLPVDTCICLLPLLRIEKLLLYQISSYASFHSPLLQILSLEYCCLRRTVYFRVIQSVIQISLLTASYHESCLVFRLLLFGKLISSLRFFVVQLPFCLPVSTFDFSSGKFFLLYLIVRFYLCLSSPLSASLYVKST